MVPKTVYTYDVVFYLPFCTCCEPQKCEVGAFFRELITNIEFENLSSTSTSQVATVKK